MSCNSNPYNNTISVLVEVCSWPPWEKVIVGIGCFYLMCCEPLLPKLCDVFEYF